MGKVPLKKIKDAIFSDSKDLKKGKSSLDEFLNKFDKTPLKLASDSKKQLLRETIQRYLGEEKKKYRNIDLCALTEKLIGKYKLLSEKQEKETMEDIKIVKSHFSNFFSAT